MTARRTMGHDDRRDQGLADEARVVLDAAVHDLRTPLSAMSGWLDVLETQVVAPGGITAKALEGLRRGIDQQVRAIGQLAEALVVQHDATVAGEMRPLSGPLLAAFARLEAGEASVLRPIDVLYGSESPPCIDQGGALVDALATFLRTLARACRTDGGLLEVDARADRIAFRFAGDEASAAVLDALCNGLASPRLKVEGFTLAALWAARTVLHRAGLALALTTAGQGERRATLRFAPGPADADPDRDGQDRDRTGDGTGGGIGGGIGGGAGDDRAATPATGPLGRGEGGSPARFRPGAEAGARSEALGRIGLSEAESDAQSTLAGWTPAPRTVLIVDDQKDIREMIGLWLRCHHYTVVLAESAREARERLHEIGPVNAAVIDIRMPGEDGISLMRSIRDFEQRHGVPPMPALAITAQPSADTRDSAIEAGFSGLVAKPLRLRHLLDILARLPPVPSGQMHSA